MQNTKYFYKSAAYSEPEISSLADSVFLSGRQNDLFATLLCGNCHFLFNYPHCSNINTIYFLWNSKQCQSSHSAEAEWLEERLMFRDLNCSISHFSVFLTAYGQRECWKTASQWPQIQYNGEDLYKYIPLYLLSESPLRKMKHKKHKQIYWFCHAYNLDSIYKLLVPQNRFFLIQFFCRFHSLATLQDSFGLHLNWRNCICHLHPTIQYIKAAFLILFSAKKPLK